MTKALLIIDYTNDFVASDGSLTCGKVAQDLEDYLVNLADKFYKKWRLCYLSDGWSYKR